jgi:riboflavin kinase/FMN adenylyltransferase
MFDGIHPGHRMVLDQAIRAARIGNYASVVFSFSNHPQSVISQTPTKLLSSLDERLAAFEAMGFDAALILPFTPELKDMTAEDFVKTILIDTLRVKAVSVGYDNRFGRGRRGDGDFLREQGDLYGFDVTVVEPVKVDQQIVSSTLIRKLLTYGELEKANRLLGRPYTLSGTVVSGHGRGKEIGFPTANIAVSDDRLVPALGVYAGMLSLDGQASAYAAVCNIGHAPTFGGEAQPRMEVHVLGQAPQDFYNHRVRFAFHHRLREERAFPNVSELVRQIEFDCAEARRLLMMESTR